MHPDVETGGHQLRTPKRSLEILAIRFLPRCAVNARDKFINLASLGTLNTFKFVSVILVTHCVIGLVINQVTVVNEGRQ